MTSASLLLAELRARLSELPPARVLAVSGGLDSMLLLSLHLLHTGPVFVVHINYGRRGAASDADEALVAEVCRLNGLPFFCFFYDDEALPAQGNFQEEARRFRYARFEELRRAAGADIILTAHHADDQRESLLFQTLRSGDPGDICGIAARTQTLARPFLNIPKTALRGLAEHIGLPWREDASNAKTAYTRNALRHQLIPLLEARLPQWGRSMEQLSEAGTALHQAAEALLARITRAGEDGHHQLLREAWLSHPEPLRTRLLHAWLRKSTDQDETGLTRAALQQLSHSLPQLQSGRYADVGGRRIWRERKYFTMSSARAAVANPADPNPAGPPPADIAAGALPMYGLRCGRLRLDIVPSVWNGRPRPAGPPELWLEIARQPLGFPLKLRRWQAGDRIQPLGMAGHQKISDVLTNKKVPALQREAALLLCSANGEVLALMWPQPLMPGGIIAAAAACRRPHEPSLRLRLQPAGRP